MDTISYIDILKKWQAHNLTSNADLDLVLDNYQILFAYHSNSIENAGLSLHQTREVFEHGKVMNYTGDTRALFETQNQKTCFQFIKPHILDKTPISPDFIQETHLLLNQGCYDENRWSKGDRPGTFKKNYYGVGSNAGVLPEDVEEEINFLCEEINELNTDEPEKILLTAAYFHCNFENIHPFADGNGRTGRTLMNYFLMTHGLPPTILFEEDKETYYMALAVFDETEQLDGFVQFLKEQTIKTWVREPIRRKGKGKIICL